MNMRDEGVHATDAGKRTHALLEAAKDSEPAQIEPWVTVQLTDEGEERIVIYDITKMARLLWQHNPKDEVIGFEVEFVKTLHGIPFKGVIDRLSVDYILDYKTTGGSLQYAKTPFKLKKDVQRLIYHAVHPTKYALWVTGTWANSAGALRANAKLEGAVVPYTTLASQLTRDEKRDAENFKTYVLTPAEEIALVAPGTHPLSFEIPTNAFSPYDSPCKKFPPDGCPHYDTCHKGKSLRAALQPKVEPVSLLEVLKEEVPAPLPVVIAAPEVLIENLYIDCLPMFPTDEPITFGAPLIAKAEREVAGDTGLAHALLADFAKGPPRVAIELEAQLELLAPVKHFYLQTKSSEARGVMSRLIGRSRNVFQGFL
jgi:hypothetical protein